MMNSDDFLAGILISIEAFTGLVLIVAVLYGCFKISSMNSPFGLLTINQNIAQFFACFTSFSFFFLGLVINFQFILTYNYFFGGSSTILLFVLIFAFFLISLNRFVAVGFPLKYGSVFNKRSLKTFLILNWLLPIISMAYLFIFKNCALEFNHFGWIFRLTENRECGQILGYAVFIYYIILIPATVLMDIATCVILIFIRSRFSNSRQLRKTDINFAVQVVVQGFFFMNFMFFYQKGSILMPETMNEEWKIFWSSSFSSVFLNVVDPLIIFVCNNEFRKWILQSISRKKSIILVTSGSHF